LAGCSPALTPARDATIVVRPGESIQAAIDRAPAGAKIVVMPGIYRERPHPCPFDRNETCAISITKDGVSLVSNAGEPVLVEPRSKTSNGVGVGSSLDCSSRVRATTVSHFRASGFSASDFVVACARDWLLDDDAAAGNAVYGFETANAQGGTVRASTATGAGRAGFHVGRSRRIVLQNDVARENVIGFELRDAVETVVEGSLASNNTAGIFESITAGRGNEASRKNVVRRSEVRDNNRPNRCDAGDPVCKIAPGVGVAVIGGDDDTNETNRISGNATFGIAVLDYCAAFNIDAGTCKQLPFDPYPRNTTTRGNRLERNGVDLLWSGTGTGNCWERNRASTSKPASLPACT
jgi:hypothetical protein